MNIKADPSGNGKWLLRLDNGTAQEFDSNQEAKEAMTKVATARAIVGCVQSLSTVLDSGPDLWQEYFDVVNAQGAFTDADLESLGISANNLASCVTLLENLKKFFAAEAVNPDAYRVVVNRVRCV